MNSLLLRASAVLAALGLASGVGAQATTLIDPSDPVYGDIRLLAGTGLLKRQVIGQQPLSRLQLATLLTSADSVLADAERSTDTVRAITPKLSALSRKFLRDLIVEISRRFEIEVLPSGIGRLRIRPRRALISQVSVDAEQADSPTRSIPKSNGLGVIDGVLNPLLSNRQGRQLVDGSNVIVGSAHMFESQHFAVSLHPELDVLGPDNHARTVLQDGAIRILYGNVAIDAGREYVRWGQGIDVGLLGSNNAPPLDLIRVSNERLGRLPWVFHALGPTKFSLFYARLGSEQNFPNPYFVGYKLSVAPADNFELGGVIYSKSGGHGAPRATFSARLMDLFPFLDASGYANKVGLKGVFEFSDRYAGADARWRLSQLAGTEVYAELLMNDFDVRRLGSVLWQDAGHIFGVRLPPLSQSGRLQGWLEFHHTGDRYYEHAQFLSGQTSKGLLVGDPLGPDAYGGYGNTDWYGSAHRRYSVQVAVERRSNDQFRYWDVPLPRFGWSRVEERPKEWRARVLATWRELTPKGGFTLLGQLGYERAQNFNFIRGVNRNNLLARVGLEYLFR